MAKGKVYIVSFRTLDHRRPSKFIVLADNIRAAIDMAWEHGHGGSDFQSRFDKSTTQAQEMKEGALTRISHQEKNRAVENIERRPTSPAMTLLVAKAAAGVD